MKLHSNFSEVSEEASFVHYQIVEAAKENPEIQSLYKGCHVLFSPLIHRPKIPLIGFNPDGGYYIRHR